MGSADGSADERPRRARIERPFWMGTVEVTNQQFARFDPMHDSRLESGDFLQFSVRERGYPVNRPEQPVCRVSWAEAMAFCRWLSERTGQRVTLPTEEQWEWACRAGTDTPLWWGEAGADFAKRANLADKSLRHVDTFGWGLPSGAVPPWRPAIESVDDGHRVSAPVGSYAPNPWGLHDMHGNVAEWTRSVYGESDQGGGTSDEQKEKVADGRSSPGTGHSSLVTRRVVRGGSWYDRPRRARSAWRLGYPAWQGVYDVGFRIILLPSEKMVRK
jgi:formylglycine-generating enzyme required for sulfatase activity